MSTDFYFNLKKFFLSLLYPSSVIFIFLLIVSIYVVLGKRRGRRRFLLFVALFLYYISSTPFFPYLLFKYLERKQQIPPLEQIKTAKYLIVLNGKVYNHKNLSLEERFSRETLVRVLKAIEIKKQFPQKELLILGGSSNGESVSQYFQALAYKWEVNLKTIEDPKDTFESVKYLKKFLSQSNESFILFTSAYHIPRTSYLMEKEGLRPIFYPTNYNYKLCKPSFSIWSFIPDDIYITFTNMAVHEYLGLFFYKLKYFIGRFL
ncbi:MAG: YdcF family protein [Thermodesulfobacterium sp.]|nr:YdcF family protein [Thermodesulfobacterium sp.]